jgi:hypothetical protein
MQSLCNRFVIAVQSLRIRSVQSPCNHCGIALQLRFNRFTIADETLRNHFTAVLFQRNRRPIATFRYDINCTIFPYSLRNRFAFALHSLGSRCGILLRSRCNRFAIAAENLRHRSGIMYTIALQFLRNRYRIVLRSCCNRFTIAAESFIQSRCSSFAIATESS